MWGNQVGVDPILYDRHLVRVGPLRNQLLPHRLPDGDHAVRLPEQKSIQPVKEPHQGFIVHLAESPADLRENILTDEDESRSPEPAHHVSGKGDNRWVGHGHHHVGPGGDEKRSEERGDEEA